MSNWNRQHETRDPLDLLIEKEARTCKGCRFHSIEKCFGQAVESCGLQMRKIRKCTLYAERE